VLLGRDRAKKRNAAVVNGDERQSSGPQTGASKNPKQRMVIHPIPDANSGDSADVRIQMKPPTEDSSFLEGEAYAVGGTSDSGRTVFGGSAQRPFRLRKDPGRENRPGEVSSLEKKNTCNMKHHLQDIFTAMKGKQQG